MSAGFSYAQAARGQSAHLPNGAPTASSSEETRCEPIAGTAATAPTDATKPSSKLSLGDGSSSFHKLGPELPLSPTTSSTLVATNGESTPNLSLDEGAATNGDKHEPFFTSANPASSADEAWKGAARNSKPAHSPSQKDAMSKEEETPKVELAPAPVPAVNIWSLRMKEQAAKKPSSNSVSLKPAAPMAGPTVSTPALSNGGSTKHNDFKNPGAAPASTPAPDAGNSSTGNGKSSVRRANDVARAGVDQPRRTGPRGARGAEKDEGLATPGHDVSLSVHNATSWPTPGSAVPVEDSKARAATDKPGPIEKDTADEAVSSKSRKKGWVHVPFVPTVNFQTPIPNTRATKAKPSTRNPREPAPRTPHGGSNGASLEKMPQTASTLGEDKNDSDAHDAKGKASTVSPTRSATNGSVPYKRTTGEPRKPTASPMPEKPEDQTSISSKNDSGHKADNHSAPNGQQSTSSLSVQSDRRLSYVSKAGLHPNPLGKEFVPQEHRNHGQFNRGERVARGGYRGNRGGNGSFQGQHAGHTSHQVNGQRTGGSTLYNGALPAAATPFSPLSHHGQPSLEFYGAPGHSGRSNGRGSSRSQMAAQHIPLQGRANENNRMHLPPHHGAAMMPVDQQLHHLAYPSMVPFMEPELVNGLLNQVEYYFSVDNLCKDVYLRKKMNDQGFVPLSTIAKFRRMSELAPSIDFIRAACEQSESLDYIVDQEQKEWIRCRHLWGSFVLPIDDRDEDARKAGPDLRTSFFRSTHSRPQQPYGHYMSPGTQTQQQQMHLQGVYPASGHEAVHAKQFQPAHGTLGNGNDAVQNDTPSSRPANGQLSASVPEFSPTKTVHDGEAVGTI